MIDGDVVTVVGAVLAGGGVTQLVSWVTHRRQIDAQIKASKVSLSQAGFAQFYETWQAETVRLHRELGELRQMVMNLSAEVTRLGGDPLVVRYADPEPGSSPPFF